MKRILILIITLLCLTSSFADETFAGKLVKVEENLLTVKTPVGTMKTFIPEKLLLNGKEVEREELIKILSLDKFSSSEVQFTVDDNGHLKSLYLLRSMPR